MLVNKLVKFKSKAKHKYFFVIFLEKKISMYYILGSYFIVKIHKSNI